MNSFALALVVTLSTTTAYAQLAPRQPNGSDLSPEQQERMFQGLAPAIDSVCSAEGVNDLVAEAFEKSSEGEACVLKLKNDSDIVGFVREESVQRCGKMLRDRIMNTRQGVIRLGVRNEEYVKIAVGVIARIAAVNCPKAQ